MQHVTDKKTFTDFLFLLSGKKENFDSIAAGDNFTDKRFFTYKPLIKREMTIFGIVFC